MSASDPTADLAPGLSEALAEVEAAFPGDVTALPLAQQRERYRALCRRFDAGRPAGLAVADTAVEGPAGRVPVRVYEPADADAATVLVYMHGGGWVFGDLESHDAIVARLAAAAGVRAVAVDYRLAPEHPFPAAVEDAAAVLDAVRTDPEALGLPGTERALVGGDSAGGNLAAVLALQGGTDGLLALYPAFDFRLDSDSCRALAEAPALTLADMRHYRDTYLGARGDPEDPRASPLHAEGFDRLPPCVLHAAALDPLRDDATRFAERTEAAGIATRTRVFDGLVHGYLRMAGRVPAAETALRRAAEDLRWLVHDDTRGAAALTRS